MAKRFTVRGRLRFTVRARRRQQARNFNERNDAVHLPGHSLHDEGSTLYAIALAWPENGKLSIRTLAAGSAARPKEVARVELLGAGGPLSFTRTDQALVVTLPERKPNESAYALKIV